MHFTRNNNVNTLFSNPEIPPGVAKTNDGAEVERRAGAVEVAEREVQGNGAESGLNRPLTARSSYVQHFTDFITYIVSALLSAV